MNKTHHPFIDWMKCLGILVIVYGHVAGWTIDHLTPPILPKQLGVAFFIFVLSFGLARETRPRWAVVSNRLFEVFLFGIAFALVMSLCAYGQLSWLEGNFAPRLDKLAGSNYEPFLLGINVRHNHFPANPTTWYIGTYIHVLLLWALVLRPLRVRPWMLVLAALGEIAVRATVMETCGFFTAYMLLPNWIMVFLVGTYYGQRPEEPRQVGLALPLAGVAGLSLLIGVWPWLLNRFLNTHANPFTLFETGSPVAALLATSAAVTVLYLLYTLFTYHVVVRLPDFAVVRFFARNTLVIFIVHMPLYSWTQTSIDEWFSHYLLRTAARLFFYLLLPAVASELLYRLIQPKVLREKLHRLWRGRKSKQELATTAEARTAWRAGSVSDRSVPDRSSPLADAPTAP
jgi:hypothetical protein